MKLNSQINKVISNLKRDMVEVAEKVVDAVSGDMVLNAQINFDTSVPYVPADDPRVDVSRSVNGKSATITCVGNQVLFIEFGAGAQNSMTQATKVGGLRVLSATPNIPYRRVIWVRGATKDIPAHGFSFGGNRLHEEAPRPSGIVGLGEYGKHLGKNDYWIYKSYSGRVAQGDNVWRIGKEATYIQTKGIAPVRALWRARNNALNKLNSGRLKIK